MTDFNDEVAARIVANAGDQSLLETGRAFMEASIGAMYSYNFSALGRPIIQYPQDIVALQELIWRVRPDLIIEAGIAHGGSLVLHASMLALLDYCDAVAAGGSLDPKATRRRVLGIDIDIRAHNRAAILAHPMSHRIDMIEGSSIAPDIVSRVHAIAGGHDKVMVILDSNHTHAHVLAELEAYAPLTSKGSYCIVFDTIVEDLPEGSYPERPWGKGDNPKTAVWRYLQMLGQDGRKAADGDPLRLEIDASIDAKLVVSVALDGYLRRV